MFLSLCVCVFVCVAQSPRPGGRTSFAQHQPKC